MPQHGTGHPQSSLGQFSSPALPHVPAPCPCPIALTSREWIHLPDAPNYSGWRWPLAHLSLNQALPSALSRAVQLTACAWHGIKFFFTFLGMIYRTAPHWDTFYFNELILLRVSWRPLRVMGALAAAAWPHGTAGGCGGQSRGLGCSGKRVPLPQPPLATGHPPREEAGCCSTLTRAPPRHGHLHRQALQAPQRALGGPSERRGEPGRSQPLRRALRRLCGPDGEQAGHGGQGASPLPSHPLCPSSPPLQGSGEPLPSHGHQSHPTPHWGRGCPQAAWDCQGWQPPQPWGLQAPVHMVAAS